MHKRTTMACRICSQMMPHSILILDTPSTVWRSVRHIVCNGWSICVLFCTVSYYGESKEVISHIAHKYSSSFRYRTLLKRFTETLQFSIGFYSMCVSFTGDAVPPFGERFLMGDMIETLDIRLNDFFHVEQGKQN